MPPHPHGDPVAADDDEDFRIALRALLLTAPHMTRTQLGDLGDMITELMRARDAGDNPEPLFSRTRRRPPEPSSFLGK